MHIAFAIVPSIILGILLVSIYASAIIEAIKHPEARLSNTIGLVSHLVVICVASILLYLDAH